MNYRIAIMAGGLGTRMKSSTPKFLHKINNKHMIVYSIEACLGLPNVEIIYIILSPSVLEQCQFLHAMFPNRLEFVFQECPRGTGHAIQCLPLKTLLPTETLLVLNADMPNIQTDILKSFLEYSNEKCAIIGAKLENPKGYGRLILTDQILERIEEDKDTMDKENKLCNMGIYCFLIGDLHKHLYKLDTDNKSNEYYLTQIFQFIKETMVYQIPQEQIKYLKGVNTPDELADILQDMIIT